MSWTKQAKFDSFQWSRKPDEWSDIRKTYHELTNHDIEEISELPVIILDDMNKPFELFEIEVPQYFVGKRGDKFYLINTEGYKYIRYAILLEGWPPPREV